MAPKRSKRLRQCKTCPWRADADTSDIPNYDRDLHINLDKTINSGLQSLFCERQQIMACHYSKPGYEYPCAGWLHHQIGDGNNLGMRVAVITGKYPPPEVDGPQHERFEDTIPIQED